MYTKTEKKIVPEIQDSSDVFSIRGKQQKKRSLICRRKSIETIRDLSSEKNNEKKYT